mmetsp:Transcript_23206/g.65873  ORF Transcript_23206/g.65873 Transcript_23206/m.65873 type:complete len:489 (+) Transcript_23206:354-1820(+)
MRTDLCHQLRLQGQVLAAALPERGGERGVHDQGRSRGHWLPALVGEGLVQPEPQRPAVHCHLPVWRAGSEPPQPRPQRLLRGGAVRPARLQRLVNRLPDLLGRQVRASGRGLQPREDLDLALVGAADGGMPRERVLAAVHARDVVGDQHAGAHATWVALLERSNGVQVLRSLQQSPVFHGHAEGVAEGDLALALRVHGPEQAREAGALVVLALVQLPAQHPHALQRLVARLPIGAGRHGLLGLAQHLFEGLTGNVVAQLVNGVLELLLQALPGLGLLHLAHVEVLGLCARHVKGGVGHEHGAELGGGLASGQLLGETMRPPHDRHVRVRQNVLHGPDEGRGLAQREAPARPAPLNRQERLFVALWEALGDLQQLRSPLERQLSGVSRSVQRCAVQAVHPAAVLCREEPLRQVPHRARLREPGCSPRQRLVGRAEALLQVVALGLRPAARQAPREAWLRTKRRRRDEECGAGREDRLHDTRDRECKHWC